MANSFYKAPVVKSLVVVITASSLMYGTLVSSSLIAVWALSSIGRWLSAVLVLYHCRQLEQQSGSLSFARRLLSSVLLGSALFVLLACLINGPQITGVLVNVVIGSLTAQCLSSLTALHSASLFGVYVSSNLPYYILALVLSMASLTALLAILCGLVAGVLTNLTGSLPLTFPLWLISPLAKVVAVEMPPPVNFSGATINVQRQQRMDHLESVVMNLQHRHQARHHQRPSEVLVQQLTSMGFPRQAAVGALTSTGSDLAAAIQLLTARNT